MNIDDDHKVEATFKFDLDVLDVVWFEKMLSSKPTCVMCNRDDVIIIQNFLCASCYYNRSPVKE